VFHLLRVALGAMSVRLIACLSALEQLRLDRLYVVHAGRDRFPLAKSIEAMPLADVAREV
jgi:hypothetical protein